VILADAGAAGVLVPQRAAFGVFAALVDVFPPC